MPSFPAKPVVPRRVVVLVYPGVTLLDATGPAQVFSSANEVRDLEAPAYDVALASQDGGPVASDAGIALGTISIDEAGAASIDTLLVAGGLGVFEAARDSRLSGWIRDQAASCRRVGSTCMGAFLTAAAGLLAGRRVVTHWRWCEALQKRHPDVEIEPDAIFLRDGPVWSSAGVTAGIDLALAMVEEDLGYGRSLAVARSLVVYLKRPGGQSQFSAALDAQARDGAGAFDGLHAWIAGNLAGDLRVERLAAQAGMSPRSFARHYAAQTGMTPAKAVEAQRIEAVRRLLEQTHLPLAAIAARCGFRDENRLRRAFLRQVGTAPSSYRRRFAQNGKVE